VYLDARLLPTPPSSPASTGTLGTLGTSPSIELLGVPHGEGNALEGPHGPHGPPDGHGQDQECGSGADDLVDANVTTERLSVPDANLREWRTV
jgi:hypothetical protein